MATYQFSNVSPATSLNGGITDSASSLVVNDETGYPAVPFKIRINAEVVTVAAKSGTTFSSLVRGDDVTTAVAHSDGDQVEHVVTAEDIMPRYDASADNYIMQKPLNMNAAAILDASSVQAGSYKPQGAGGQNVLEDDTGAQRIIIETNAADGDIFFKAKNGTTTTMVWDETDSQWEFVQDVEIRADLNVQTGNLRVEQETFFGATGDSQVRWYEGATAWVFALGNNANVFIDRIKFNTTDDAGGADIIFFAEDGSTVTLDWDESQDEWRVYKNLDMNANTITYIGNDRITPHATGIDFHNQAVTIGSSGAYTMAGPDSGDLWQMYPGNAGDHWILAQFDDSGSTSRDRIVIFGKGTVTDEGDVHFVDLDGVNRLLLWDESADNWAFQRDVIFQNSATLAGVSNPTTGSMVGDRDYNDARYVEIGGDTMTGSLRTEGTTTFGAAGDAQLRVVEEANGWVIETGSNANVFLKRLRFQTSDHGDGADILFLDENGTSNTLLWDNNDFRWEIRTDLQFQVGAKLMDVADPTAGNHVGDRDYNDARYVLQ